MRPTAMQKPPNKEGGKTKPSTPPAPPPKQSTTTTITVVCNGVRSSSLPGAEFGMNETISRDGIKTAAGVHRSTVTVGESSKKEPPPVSPREKHVSVSMKSQAAPSVNSQAFLGGISTPSPSLSKSSSSSSINSPPVPPPPPPVAPRFKSESNTATTNGFAIAVNGNGHYSAAAATINNNNHNNNMDDNENVTQTDFFSSLPSLPTDDYVVSSLSTHLSDKTSTQKDKKTTPSIPPPKSPSPRIETTSTSTKIVVSNSAVPTTPPSNRPPSESSVRSVSPSEPSKPCPPPVSRKPAVSQLPQMSGIAENGTLHEEDQKEEETHYKQMRQRFYMSMKNVVPPGPGADGSETTFAGRRDVKNPKSLLEKEIVSSKGTVRGFKNRVRAGIVTFVDESTASKFNYRILEKEKIVVYATSMLVVRETADRCKTARNILQNHMVRFEQRDLYMSLDHQKQLRKRLNTDLDVPLPQIFIDGIHIGGANDLEKLNEAGELRKILQTFPKIQVRTMCDTCGGYRYVPCIVCHGSKKSVHRNNFTEEFCALRCMHCNDNGLQRCQDCMDQQE